MKYGLRISKSYIYERHETASCDEVNLGTDSSKPATFLCKMADKAKKFIFIRDDVSKSVLRELVSGAWHYEGMEDECDMLDSDMKLFCETARRIRKRWEGKISA